MTVSGITASDKTYDGNTNATLTGTAVYSGLVNGDTFTGSYTGVFANANVGTGKTVTVNSITLANGSNGGLAANYSISPGQTTTANVTAKALTVSGITASNKTYDANAVATLDATSVAYTGKVNGDDFNGTYTGAFSDKNVGTSKTVTITPSYTGADVSNYSVTDHSTVTANITTKALTVSGITALDKGYDGNATATLDTSLINYGGLVSIMPKYAFVFMVFTLGAVGLPGTTGFVGEFLILMGAFKKSFLVAAIASIGVILSAAYMLWLYKRVIFGDITKDEVKKLIDLNKSEVLILSLLALPIIFFGFYPEPLLNTVEVSVRDLIEMYNTNIKVVKN